MLEKMKNKIEICEEKGIKNTSLYVKNVNINEESYETKMLLEESIENVLKFQMVYEGEERVLRYEVSNTISFDEYLKSYKLKKEDICDIIDSIDSVLNSIENYLIEENSIALDFKLIRVEHTRNKKLNIKFVIIPNYNSDFSYELSKFLIRMLRFIDVEDKDALKLAYGLFVRSSKENYTINDLLEITDIVKENNRAALKVFDEEALSAYDEKIISEMSKEVGDEGMYENINESINDNFDNLDTKQEEKITIDKKTNNILKEELFDNFDEKDHKGEKKIIKFRDKIFNTKKNKMLNAHIIVNICKSVMVPLACIIIPMLVYILYGVDKFMKYLPVICLYEIILLTVYVISSIMSSKGISSS